MATEELGVEIFVEGWQKFNSMMDGAEKKVSGFASAAGKIGANMQTVGKLTLGAAGVAVGAIGTIVVAGSKLAADAAKYDSIRNAFGSMTEGMGISADELESRVSAASGGTLDRMTILQNATRSLSLIGAGAFDDFGGQFEDMATLAKKAARATGEDVNFMFDSLVTGMARESKMILDNLGINVDLVQAKKDYAEEIGKTVEEMTQEESKAAVLNATLGALEETYGNVEVSSGGLGGAMQSMKSFMKDLALEAGLILTPIVNELARTIFPLLQDTINQLLPYFQRLVDIVASEVVPVIVEIIGYVSEFVSAILSGEDPLTAVGELLKNFIPPDIVDRILEIVTVVQDFVTMAWDWISQNVELQDILIALGIAIATVVLPVLYGIVAAAAPIIATFVAVVAVVALLRKAWENNFLGIQDKTQAVMGWIQENVPTIIENVREFITNAIATIRAWWAENGDAILAKASEIWTMISTTIQTVIENVSEFVTNAIATIRAWWAENGDAILAKASEIWTMISTTIQTVIEYIQNTIEMITAAISGDWETFGNKLKENWGLVWDAIKEILSAAWTSLVDIVGSIVEIIRIKISQFMDGIKKTISEKIEAVKEHWQSVWDSINTILVTIWENIKSWLKSKVEEIFNALGLDLEEMKEKWSVIWEDVKAILTRVWEIISTFVAEKAEAIRSKIEEKLNTIREAWSIAWDAVSTKASEIWDTISTFVAEKVEAIRAVVEEKVDAIREKWGPVWDAIKTKLSEVAGAMLSAITEKVTEIYNIVTSKIEEIKSWIGGKISEFSSVGSNLIQGLIDGVLAKAGELVSAVTDAIGDALDAAKETLGIESPSKVFQIVGQETLAGMVLGMEDMIPQVQATMTAAVSPPRAAAISPTATPGVQNQVSNQTVNNYNLTTQTTMQPGGLAMEFSTFSMATR